MSAIVVHEFGPARMLRLEEVPDAKPPGPSEVLIRVRAAVVNPIDTLIRSPADPGNDGAGTHLPRRLLPPGSVPPGTDRLGLVAGPVRAVARTVDAADIRGAGHWLTEEQPQAVTDHILQFLDR